MSRARPGDRRVLEVVRPSLSDLANTIDQALRRSWDLTTPLQKKKEPSMASEDTISNEEADDIFDEGMEHWWAGDRRTACRFFRRALKIDSEHADAHNHLGIDMMDKGRLEEAEKRYEAAIEGGQRHLVRDHGLVEWGHLENRPYLRALGNLALLLDLRT